MFYSLVLILLIGWIWFRFLELLTVITSGIMDSEAAWVHDRDFDDGREDGAFKSYLEMQPCDFEREDENFITIDLIIPNDIIERILAYLPMACIVRAGSVCKNWYKIVHSGSFASIASTTLSRKPWYFMFAGSEPFWYAYDPTLKKWYNFEFPYVESSSWTVTSSDAFACFLDHDRQNKLCVCNPITMLYKKLQLPPCFEHADYSALAISVDRSTHNYTVALAVCKHDDSDGLAQWEFHVYVYRSESMMWESPVTGTLQGWRGGEHCVVCDGVLYVPVYSTVGLSWNGGDHSRLLAFHLCSQPSSFKISVDSLIPLPCSLTCCRLMDLNNQLVLVGGIEKRHRRGRIKGIGIWMLFGNYWESIARMPDKYFQGFEEMDDVFNSSGMDDMIYIHSYGTPSLLTFDMNMKAWKWTRKCPVVKKCALPIFTGFCSFPLLHMSP